MGGLGGFYGLSFFERSMESLGCLEGVDSETIFDLIFCIENVLLGRGKFWNCKCFDTLLLCSVQEIFVMGRPYIPRNSKFVRK